jgi:hypothetical protein
MRTDPAGVAETGEGFLSHWANGDSCYLDAGLVRFVSNCAAYITCLSLSSGTRYGTVWHAKLAHGEKEPFIPRLANEVRMVEANETEGIPARRLQESVCRAGQ